MNNESNKRQIFRDGKFQWVDCTPEELSLIDALDADALAHGEPNHVSLKTETKIDPAKNKPLIEMSDKEREEVFDEIGGHFSTDLVDTARRELEGEKDPRDQSSVAACFLITDDGRFAIIMHSHEYGDGEGERAVADIANTILRLKYLRSNERLVCGTARIDVPDLYSSITVFDPKDHA